MKVAIIEPLNLSHRIRGTGFYTQNLFKSLQKYYPREPFSLGRIVSNNTDLVHYPFFEPFFLSLPLKKKGKTIVTVHDLTPLVFKDKFPIGPKGKLKWEIQKRSLKNCDGVITDSENSKKDILKFTGLAEDRIHVAYLAPSEDFGKTVGEELKKTLQKKYSLPDQFLLYVGDATWNKNLPNILKAVGKTSYNLVIAGGAFKNKEINKKNLWNRDLVEAQKLAEENEKVISLGYVDDSDLPALYTLATAFIMPSFYEGFGLPVVEAMASGCPVITSEEGSLKEIAGEAALFVDPYSVDSISEGIEKIMSDSLLREELIERGKKQASKFSWKKTAAETMAVYKKVINE